MNLDILKGKWKELSGKLKTEFAELTDDDIAKISGELESLTGVIQNRYGIAKEEAEEKIEKFLEKQKSS